jgi:hypothetical protein
MQSYKFHFNLILYIKIIFINHFICEKFNYIIFYNKIYKKTYKIICQIILAI